MSTESLTAIEPEQVFVEVDGGKVSLLKAGTGPATLLLHSAGGARAWSPLHQALASERSLYAPDHPGFGNSDDFPELSTVGDIADHYIRLLDVLGLDSVDLIGSSFGSWISAELTIRAPERVRSLTLQVPAGLVIDEQPLTNIFALSPVEVVEHLFDNPETVKLVLSTPPSEEAMAATVRDMTALARFASEPPLSDPTLRGRLHLISAPTHVIAASEDRLVPRLHAETYASEIPNGRLTVIEGAGHILDGERPDETIAATLNFLRAQ